MGLISLGPRFNVWTVLAAILWYAANIGLVACDDMGVNLGSRPPTSPPDGDPEVNDEPATTARSNISNMDHLQILDSLLKQNYDRRATPTNYQNKATHVQCELYIRSFGSINPSKMDYEVDLYLRQKWKDQRLKHRSITKTLDLNDPNLVKAIWKPEVYFPNAKHAEFQFVTVPNVLVRINPDGEILYMLRLKLTFSCMMDLSKFPLDSQVCTMEVASFSKTIEELQLKWKNKNPVIMGKGLRMPQFEIADIRASDCQESFQIGNYSCLVAEFYLNRSVGFHLIQSYLPTILIVIISWVSFWMDVDSVPGRTTLGVTTLLAVSSQSSGIQAGLPQVSYVKAIDVWMGTCTAFVFCALLEFTFVNYMWRKLQPSLLCKVVAVGGDSGGGGDYQAEHNGKNQELTGEGEKENNTPMGVTLMRKVNMGSPESNPGPHHTETKYSMGPNYSERARRIDEYSRLLFPLTFLVFNMFYWSYYLGFN